MAVGKVWHHSSLPPAAVSIPPTVSVSVSPSSATSAPSEPPGGWHSSLRFTPELVGADIQLSASGLVACMGVAEKQLAAMNKAFSSGVHYWEIVCPVSCAGLEFGVVQGNANLAAAGTSTFVKFKNTTPRIVGVELNLYTLRVSFFLNGRLQDKKFLSLSRGAWRPALWMQDKDTVAIINPYCTPHELQWGSYTHHIGLSNLLSAWICVSPIPHRKLEALRESAAVVTLPRDAQSSSSFLFIRSQSPGSAEELTAELLASDMSVAGGELLSAWVQQLDFTMENKTFLDAKEWIRGNFSQFFETSPYVDKSKLAAAMASAKAPAVVPAAEDLSVSLFYIPCTDNLLAVSGDRLKLVPKRRGRLLVSPYLFSEPQSRTDTVWLSISSRETEAILHAIEFNAADLSAEILPLLQAFATLHATPDEHYISGTLEDLALGVQHILYLLTKSMGMNDVTEIEQRVLIAMESLLRLDEEMRLVAPKDAADLWPERVSRIYTAECRLSSLLCASDRASQSQRGVVNTKDWLKAYSHFQSQSTVLASLTDLPCQLPNVQLLAGLPSANVPLSVVISGRSQCHPGLHEVLTDTESPWVLTFSLDGCVRLWDASTQLTELAQVDVTKFSDSLEGRKDDIEKETMFEQHQILSIFLDDCEPLEDPALAETAEVRKMAGNPLCAAFLNMENQPETPIVIAAVSTAGEVVLKRVGFTDDYLRRFMLVTKHDNGYHSVLSGTWLEEATEAREHFACYKDVMRVVVPGNAGVAPKSLWTVIECKDIQLQASQVRAMCMSSTTTSDSHFTVFVLGCDPSGAALFSIAATLEPHKDSMKGLVISSLTQAVTYLDGLADCSRVLCTTEFLCAAGKETVKVWTKDGFQPLPERRVEGEIATIRRGKGDTIELAVNSDVRSLSLKPTAEKAATEPREPQPSDLLPLSDEMELLPQSLVAEDFLGFLEGGRCDPVTVTALHSLAAVAKGPIDQVHIDSYHQHFAVPKTVRRNRSVEVGQPIPLMVFCHTGGSYKEGHFASAILSSDSQAFTSIYPEPTFTFRHLLDVPFTPTSFTVKSNISAESGQPLGEGLIFTATYPGLFQYSSQFEGFHEAEFQQFANEKKAKGEDFEEWEPIGYFKMEEGDTMTGNFVVQRECRYAFLKPINIRPGSSKKFKDCQVEVLHFSLCGFESVATPLPPPAPTLSVSMLLEVDQGGQWTPLASTPLSQPQRPLFGSKALYSLGQTTIGPVNIPSGTRFRLSVTGESDQRPLFFAATGLAHSSESVKAAIDRALPVAISTALESESAEWVSAAARFLCNYVTVKNDKTTLRAQLPLYTLLPRSLKHPVLSALTQTLWTTEDIYPVALAIVPRIEEFAPSLTSLQQLFQSLAMCAGAEMHSTALGKLVALANNAAALRPTDLLRFQSICPSGDLNPFELCAFQRSKRLSPIPMHLSLTWNESSDKLDVRLSRRHHLRRILLVFKKGKDLKDSMRCRVDIVSKGEVLASQVCEEHLYRQLAHSGHPLALAVDCRLDRFTVLISYFLFPSKRAVESDYFVDLGAFGDPLEEEKPLPLVQAGHTSSEEVTVWGNWTQTEYSYEQDLVIAVYTGKPGATSQLQLSLTKKQTQLKTLLSKVRPEVPAVEALASEISEIQDDLSAVGFLPARSYQMVVCVAAELAAFLTATGCREGATSEELGKLFVEFVAKGGTLVRERVLELVGLIVANTEGDFRRDFVTSLVRLFLQPGTIDCVAVAKGVAQGLKFLRAPAALILSLLVQTKNTEAMATSTMLELCLYSLERASTPADELQSSFSDLLLVLAKLKGEAPLSAGLKLLSEYLTQLPESVYEEHLATKAHCEQVIRTSLDANLSHLLQPLLTKSSTLSVRLIEMLSGALAGSDSALSVKLLRLYQRLDHKTSTEAVVAALVPVLEHNAASVEIWKLALALCRTLPRPQAVVRRLIAAFLTATDSVRQTLYTDVVEVSKVIMEEQSCGELVHLMLDCFSRSLDTSSEAAALCLCRGWGELLLAQKHEDIETGRLIDFLGELLESRLTVGGVEAVSGMNVQSIQRLEFTNTLFGILLQCLPSPPPVPSDSTLLRLLSWLMLTMTKDDCSGNDGFPALSSLRQVAGKLYFLLEKMAAVAAKPLLRAAVTLAREYSADILSKMHGRQVMAAVGLSAANRLMGSFLTVVDLVLTSDELAAYFAFEVKGFEFLMEQLICESQDQSAPLEDEELASKMVMVNLLGMTFASIAAGIDWATYKKGNRNKLFTREFDGRERQEIALAFELQKPVELRYVSVGFNLFSTDTADRVYGLPSSVLLEGGESLEDLRPIAIMQVVPDFAYAHFSVGVFALNLALGALPASHRVKFLCFRVRRPVYTCIETSTLLLKNCSKSALSISFISVMGYDQELLQDVPLLISGVYKLCALKLFSRICKPEYTHTMDVISHEPEVLAQIKGSFEMLAAMLHLHESWLAHVLSQLSRANEGMAGWLLNSLLKLSRGPEHARLVYDIIQNDSKNAQTRVQQLTEFVFRSMAELNIGNETEVSSRYAPLISFVEALASSLGNLREVEVSVTRKQLDDLIDAVRLNVEASDHTKSLSRLLMCLLYPQSHLHILSDFSLESVLLSSVFTDTISKTQKSGFEDAVQCLIAYSDSAAQWALFESRLSPVLISVLDASLKDEALSTKCADLLSGFSVNETIKAELRTQQFAQRLYERLKLAKAGTNFLEKGLRTICNLVLGDRAEEQRLAECLTRDIAELQASGLVHDLLVPLLSAELRIPVFLHAFDPFNGRWVSSISEKSQGAVAQPLPFVGKTLSPQQMAEVAKSLQQVADSSEDKKSLMTAQWTQLYYLDHHPDCSTWLTFHRALELRAPVVLLLQAESRTRGDVNVAVVSFKPIPQVPDVFEDDVTASIPFDKDNFILYMEDTKTYHFDSAAVPQRHFGEVLCDYEGGGALNLAGEFLWLSFSYDYSTCIDHSGFLNCREKNCTLPGEIKVKSLEIWGCQLQDDRSTAKSTALMNKRMQWEDADHPFALLQSVPLLAVPSTATAEDFCAALFQGWVEVLVRGTDHTLSRSEVISEVAGTLPALDLEYRLDQQKETFSTAVDTHRRFPLFEAFQANNGIAEILDFAQQRLKNKGESSETSGWELWIQEIQSFFQLPSFFANFIRSESCKKMLFAVLSGDTQTKDEATSITHTYRTLAEIFRGNREKEIRLQAVKTGLIERILERLEAVDRVQHIPSSPSSRSSPDSPDSDYSVSDSGSKSDKKPKGGVGYAPDHAPNTSNWNLNSYLQSKQTQLEQKTVLIEVMTEFLEPQVWTLPTEVAKMILESQLAKFLEQNLGGDSLLEIDKEKEMFSTFLRLVKVIAGHESLHPLLALSLPKLSRLADLARTFFRCLENVDTQEKHAEALARDLISTEEFILSKATHLHASDRARFYSDALHLPLPDSYRLLLEDLRMGHMRMKTESGTYQHFYSGQLARAGNTPPGEKMYRLAREIADLSHSLPISHTNSIFVRVDEERVDLMKAMIMGAADTPYAHGAFEFDIFLEDSYPNSPPKVNLVTTGGEQVRFNPNLYNCGKVCLSLLGTWRGYATENWDPKISTLLQVLMSIQSMIMTDDIYFNEPGFEQEVNTDEGTKKNEGYCNIIRYANAKFAMLEQIRHPPKGFEVVVRRHFYLKREVILEDLRKWLADAKEKEANYSGLVQDHNTTFAGWFRDSKDAYYEKLQEVYTELEEELNSLPEPTPEDHLHLSPTVPSQSPKVLSQSVVSLAAIDVSDDSTVTVKRLNVDQRDVTDRYSRYIGAMGVDAVRKQAESEVFIYGAGPLGAEIAKNIVLSGVKKLVICDERTVTLQEVSGHCFLRAADVDRKRAQCVAPRLQQLNFYVEIESLCDSLSPDSFHSLQLSRYSVVIMTEVPWESAETLCQSCREAGVSVICADSWGLFARGFCDFGEQFVVVDKDGEETQEYVIESISNEEKALVKLVGKHNLEDGSTVQVKGVIGMAEINETSHSVTVVNTTSFHIGDTANYGKYISGGVAMHIKTPVTLQFASLRSNLASPRFDQTYQIADFEKSGQVVPQHFAMLLWDKFVLTHQRMPVPSSTEDREAAESLLSAALQTSKLPEVDSTLARKMVDMLWRTGAGTFPPLVSFLGGLISQEALKAITHKFTPLQQLLYFNCSELAPATPASTDALPVEIAVGRELMSQLECASAFMVGVGAIGCELLKNIALLGFGTKAAVTITDPDLIENSNLSRQFLFREKHLRLPKAAVAAAAVVDINPRLASHIHAKLDKVHEGSSHLFPESFFKAQSVVLNALDNLQARKYVDQRCIAARRPLIDSGTLGTKGHVQVVLPFLTETYSERSDPEDEQSIPVCTLKMFPEESLHCIEWARDLFARYFTVGPGIVRAYVQNPQSHFEGDKLAKAVRILRKWPKSFEDCVYFAWRKFHKLFRGDVIRLLYVYPPDCQTKDGRPFWSLPKRRPNPVDFDPRNSDHVGFLVAAAWLKATVCGVVMPPLALEELTSKVVEIAHSFPVKQFTTSESQATAIRAQVDSPQSSDQTTVSNSSELASEIRSLLTSHHIDSRPEDFEKDNDSNRHIDFVHSAGNCRAEAYGISKAEWIVVKIKAGRIVPALATTTAVVAGLQSLEMVKIVKSVEAGKCRNTFLNLAASVCTMTEPCAPRTFVELSQIGKVTAWSRWEVPHSAVPTLSSLFSHLHTTYNITVQDVLQANRPVYLHSLMSLPGNEQEREALLQSPLRKVLGETEEEWDLRVTFTVADGGELMQSPVVRVR